MQEEMPTATLGKASSNGHDKVIPERPLARKRRMAEKQVLFRLDEDLLAKLDQKLLTSPYKTRNAWFKAVVEDFVARSR